MKMRLTTLLFIAMLAVAALWALAVQIAIRSEFPR